MKTIIKFGCTFPERMYTVRMKSYELPRSTLDILEQIIDVSMCILSVPKQDDEPTHLADNFIRPLLEVIMTVYVFCKEKSFYMNVMSKLMIVRAMCKYKYGRTYAEAEALHQSDSGAYNIIKKLLIDMIEAGGECSDTMLRDKINNEGDVNVLRIIVDAYKKILRSKSRKSKLQLILDFCASKMTKASVQRDGSYQIGTCNFSTYTIIQMLQPPTSSIEPVAAAATAAAAAAAAAAAPAAVVRRSPHVSDHYDALLRPTLRDGSPTQFIDLQQHEAEETSEEAYQVFPLSARGTPLIPDMLLGTTSRPATPTATDDLFGISHFPPEPAPPLPDPDQNGQGL
jgi:hypothetical protein